MPGSGDGESGGDASESKVVTEIIIISGFRFEMCRVGLYSDNCPSFIPLSMLTIMMMMTMIMVMLNWQC